MGIYDVDLVQSKTYTMRNTIHMSEIFSSLPNERIA